MRKNRVVVVLSEGLVQGVYADEFRNVEVSVLDFDQDGITAEDMERDPCLVELPNGDFARAYDEQASDLRKIGVDEDNKAAYAKLIGETPCPDGCGNMLQFFMHNCSQSSNHPEIHGCPACDDDCPECR